MKPFLVISDDRTVQDLFYVKQGTLYYKSFLCLGKIKYKWLFSGDHRALWQDLLPYEDLLKDLKKARVKAKKNYYGEY